MAKMTFFGLMEKEWNFRGAHGGNQSIDQVAQAVADDILDGFGNINEAEEYIKDIDGVALYTAQGYEVDIDTFQIAISVKCGLAIFTY